MADQNVNIFVHFIMEITGCFQLFSVIFTAFLFASHIVLGYSIIDGEKSEMKWRNDTKQTPTTIMRANEKRKNGRRWKTHTHSPYHCCRLSTHRCVNLKTAALFYLFGLAIGTSCAHHYKHSENLYLFVSTLKSAVSCVESALSFCGMVTIVTTVYKTFVKKKNLFHFCTYRLILALCCTQAKMNDKQNQRNGLNFCSVPDEGFRSWIKKIYPWPSSLTF